MLIDNYLIEQEAKRLNVEVSQPEIDSQVQAIADGIKPKTLEEGLKDHHQTLAELQDDLRHRLLGLKLAAIGVKPGHYVHAHTILIKISTTDPDGHTEADGLALVKTIQAKFKAGAKFEDLATQYSQDPSTKDRGGDMGVLYDGAPYDGALVEAALALKAGEMTPDPVKTPLGYYLIEVSSMDTAHPPSEDALYAEAKWRYEMYQGNLNFYSHLDTLRTNAKITQYLPE